MNKEDCRKSEYLYKVLGVKSLFGGAPNLYAPGCWSDAWNVVSRASKEMDNKTLKLFYDWFALTGLLEMSAGQAQRLLVDTVYKIMRLKFDSGALEDDNA